MSNRTLIPSETPTEVEAALARFAEAMRHKPPKKAKLPPTKRKLNGRQATRHELFVSERIAHGTSEAEEKFGPQENTG
jgi:hypothetical protein